LIRYYGFSAKEILEGSDGNLNQDFDPKCDWALRNLDLFPVEINKADRDMLLRVPGIGVKSAYRILTARRSRKLDFADLKKLGVVMKRAQFFITCNGRSFGKIFMEPDFIKENLSLDERAPSATSYTKLSMFDMVI
jgi:predicted DNA-binding helix-hairpin-helix protein